MIMSQIYMELKSSHLYFILDEDDICTESRSPAACLHDVCQGGGPSGEEQVSNHREDAVQSDPRSDLGRAASGREEQVHHQGRLSEEVGYGSSSSDAPCSSQTRDSPSVSEPADAGSTSYDAEPTSYGPCPDDDALREVRGPGQDDACQEVSKPRVPGD